MQEPVLLKIIFKTLQDYIQNDSLSSEINDHISEIMCYIPDPEPGPSCLMDKKINTFGRRLISIFKSSHVRIVNGRHQFDPDEFYLLWAKWTISCRLTSYKFIQTYIVLQR